MEMRSKTKIPGWFVALAVLITGGLTCWAILKKRSGQQWAAAQGSLPMQITEVLSPAMAAAAQSRNMQKVAGTSAIPAIRAGAQSRHRERGACALCHTVVDNLGKGIPAIRTMASLPHRYRGGLCINCHRVESGARYPGSGSMQRVVTNPSPAPPAGLPAAAMAVPRQSIQPARKTQPTEGSWLGMEVVPITQLTATQYRIPGHVRGLVVAEAEGLASRNGVQAGDVVVAINGIPVTQMQSFLQATQSGKLKGSTLR